MEHLGNVWVHHLRLTGAGDFDAELARWLRASYVEYGQRKWLRRPEGRDGAIRFAPPA